MAWEEWEQLRSQAAERRSTHTQLDHVDTGGGHSAGPGRYGDLKVGQDDLAKIGEHAFTLYDDLWKKGRTAVPSSEKAAGNLAGEGFALGSGLKHVATRWDEQLGSLRDACGHISQHMTVTKKIHATDDHLVGRRMSSIDALDAGFDERAGAHGGRNPVYGEPGRKDGRDG
ncbi:hypothetical protein GCM10018793_22220 [Streptomyces sulfonofaciens]|uniref:AG1 protein n=1 Tax=Streptomyces sulfonofaciens TaxID=68272 RepID=A0A919G2K1_9ACTN|nr:hypothetical protein [Streptomyces sulfonofaciens]GHH76469.1 hypothetical protein GCM10018793_22220 [Streptomyces sulfonofaciens]